MRKVQCRSWLGVIALGMSVFAALPAHAAGPPGSTPAASQQAVEEAKRLQAEVEQLYAQGKYTEALPIAERVLALREKAFGAEHTDVATALNDLGVLYCEKGDFGRAEPLLLRAKAVREKALEPHHADVAESLNNLAEFYRAKGEYGRAEPLYQRALAIREKALGLGHPLVLQSLNNLATVYLAKGDYERTEPLLLRAVTAGEKALGQNHPLVSLTHHNLASMYEAKGDYGRAEPLYQHALAIRERVMGPEHPGVAQSLNSLAALHVAKGDYGRAEPLLLRALAISEKVLGPGHPDIAQFLNNLAELYRGKGDYSRAEPLYQRALAISEKALGLEHPDVAHSLNNLASVYWAQGDFGRAEPLYQRALAIREKAFGPEHLAVATTLHNLATLYAAQGRLGEAMNADRRGADIRDRNAAAVLVTGSEEQKRLYMATLTGETYRSVSLHAQLAPDDPAAARLALTVLLRRKGRVLDAMADSLAALRRTLAPADRALLDQLASVYTQLATQVSRGPGKVALEQYRANLAALEQERGKLEAELGQRSAAFRAQQRPVALADVQAALPEGAALVEIALYKPFNPRIARPVDRWGAPRYVAYVLRRKGEPVFADLGDAAALDAAVAKLRLALGDPILTHDPKPAARALDALLMQPVRKLLVDARWVFVSPDGPLSLVPFGALVDEQGHYLVERYLFSTLTSGRDLLRFQAERVAWRQAPLVLAAPSFDDISAPAAPAAPGATHRGVRSIEMGMKVAPLGNTREEAHAIARLFPDAQVLLGAQATEGAIKAAHAPRLLHLATHGFFLSERPLPDALLGGPGGEPTPAERAAIAQRENPLLRSGIALAGFNQRQSGTDDGVLTALEAAGLDLSGTQLVVLSACESGLGQAVMGEGVVGLRRTLSMAGAETQVMSLWKVDTGRTRELMIAYYQRLEAGVGRSEAMRDVQLAMLADPATVHPNLWASFVVSGDFRTLEGQARLPELWRVTPGPRGCACAQAGGEGSAHGVWLALALGVAAAARRARPLQRLSLKAQRRGWTGALPRRVAQRRKFNAFDALAGRCRGARCGVRRRRGATGDRGGAPRGCAGGFAGRGEGGDTADCANQPALCAGKVR
jgi:CHAT domain-containing protein/Tfp pilus assembly protein PilF